MNIGIDAKPLEEKKAGIGIYLEQILRIINENDKDNKYFLYTSRKLRIDFKLNDNFVIRENITSKIGELFHFLGLHKKLKEDKIDVFWGTEHILPKRSKYTKKVKYILTVHDLAIKKLKTVGSLKNTLTQKIFLRKSIVNADKIIAISEATKKDIIDIYNIKKDKVKVIYNGTNAKEAEDLERENVEKIEEKLKIKGIPYILFVSTIEPRKNVETLIKAFEYIKQKQKSKLKLIIVGKLGWKYKEVLKLYEESKYKEDILMAGYVSKEEKNYLYKNAKCFVYPSLYEGFGLPILEAMANKLLVVTSDNSSLTEVGGNAAYYYKNVLDYKELSEKIIEVLKVGKEEKQRRIDEGLEMVKKFTWDKCGEETLNLLN